MDTHIMLCEVFSEELLRWDIQVTMSIGLSNSIDCDALRWWDLQNLTSHAPSQPTSVKKMNPTLLIRYESPWNTYEKELTCDLAGDTAIVVHRGAHSETFTLSHLQHENVLSAREYYYQEESMYALGEDLSITLEDVVLCDPFLSEAQLAAILCQVILPVSFYLCLQRSEDHSAVGLTDPSRWPEDSDAVRFLAATTSVRSADELAKKTPWLEAQAHRAGPACHCSSNNFLLLSIGYAQETEDKLIEPIQVLVVPLDNEYIVRNGGLPEPVTILRIAKKRKSVMVLGTCLIPVGDLQHLSLRGNIIGHVSLHFIVVLEGCDSIEPNGVIRAICGEVSWNA
ncbi:hypothetical protein TSTA_081640 [Talaromyces stipitatus ATCC 10500]|uniref:Uncharacterized protein n=1 Tax=Talaromyces stipitatus (strain ATCC 10500 / CBS 375.48 / QM 6759 / NRRL 1006) TaxID=441959 RepID=B8LZZ9_TALSN|nr:uncharacterized protein TSTA_081640 [Talaromyces stipitatus ATCC 10500]EED20931.1 hypothetical protein TSTA_081640 [Talaromyces stipitatus ATCC 10500]